VETHRLSIHGDRKKLAVGKRCQAFSLTYPFLSFTFRAYETRSIL
jgi:hypothetical protein